MRPFDEYSLLEFGAGSDERDQVWAVDRSPAVLGGLDEFEHHGQAGGSAARPLGHLGSQPDRGEGRLDRIRGLEVDPVLGREVVEGQELLSVIDDLGDGLRVLNLDAPLRL